MWKLILADSFHLNTTAYQSSIATIPFYMYINLLMQMSDNRFMPIMLVWIFFLMLSFFISPIRIPKGLYLCPLTENDRKRYLKMALILRYMSTEILFAIAIIAAALIKKYDYRVLLLIYISISIAYLVILLISGFYNPETVKRQYFIMNRLPLPTQKQSSSEKQKTSHSGMYLLVISLIISCISIILLFIFDNFDQPWMLFYIPSYIVCILSILVYFRKYFDTFITVNANYEIYSFTPKKKAGVH